MRIVNLQTFLKLPPGTLFSKYDNFADFSNMAIFHGKCGLTDESINFVYSSIPDVDAKSDTELFAMMDEAEETGKSFKLDFDATTGDGSYNEDQRFAVWEKNDVDELIKLLTSELVTSAYKGT